MEERGWKVMTEENARGMKRNEKAGSVVSLVCSCSVGRSCVVMIACQKSVVVRELPSR